MKTETVWYQTFQLLLLSQEIRAFYLCKTWIFGVVRAFHYAGYPKESGFRDQSGFRGRGCRHGGCSLNPDPTVIKNEKW